MRYSIAILAAGVTRIYAQSSCATPVSGTIVQPSGQPQITACANSLNLGETCGADEQCKNGAQCFGSNSGIIRACGNFNAECSRDDQCAFNICNGGLCNGFKATSLYPTVSTTTTAAPVATGISPPAFCPQAGNVGAGGAFACDIASSYPASETCKLINGCFYLVSVTSTGTATATTHRTGTAPVSADSTSSTAMTSSSMTSSSQITQAPTTSTAAAQSTSSPVSTGGSGSIVGNLSGLGALIAGIAAFVL